MYLAQYNLEKKPFQMSADPEFLWFGEKHKEALAMLKYAIGENKGFLLLTGDVGTGKTTTINALVNSLGDEVIVAMISYPRLETLDFFNFLADCLKMNKKFTTKGDFLLHLHRFLDEAYNNNKKVLVVIDEAQGLNQELLDNIRLLSNIEKQNTKLIHIFFVGSKELNDILLDAKNGALRQRISVRYNIDPLTESELVEYIRHRLSVAGSKNEIFDSGAIHEIFSFSNGYPRLINMICDHALLTGHVKNKKTIDADIVKECAEELGIRTQDRKDTSIKQKPFEKITAKKFGRIPVAYIALFAAMLVIAGFLFFYGVYKKSHVDNSVEKEPVVQHSEPSDEPLHTVAERRKRGAAPKPHQDSEPPPARPYEAKTLKVAQPIPALKPTSFDAVEKDMAGSHAEEKVPYPSKLHISVWMPDQLAETRDAIPESYLQTVMLGVEEHKKYPRIAKKKHIQGNVTVRFVITPEGNVKSAEIVKTSKHGALDRAALAAVNAAAPFPKVPSHKEDIPLEIVIAFQLGTGK
ncbi:MAG: hypothetical protein BA868_02285 [Desulfobacterales bacterium C00003106]|nr:MAG: hypothetical protein BA868_02285 [Desulfobacterales bacterium C00003106]